jgi:hypothetical protein
VISRWAASGRRDHISKDADGNRATPPSPPAIRRSVAPVSALAAINRILNIHWNDQR